MEEPECHGSGEDYGNDGHHESTATHKVVSMGAMRLQTQRITNAPRKLEQENFRFPGHGSAPWLKIMGKRREARERAVQFLFQYDLNPPDDLEAALEHFWRSQRAAAIAEEKGIATWGQPVELP